MTEMPSKERDILHGQVLSVRESRGFTFADVGHPGQECPVQIVVDRSIVDTPSPRIGDLVQANGELGETALSKRRGLGQVSLFTDEIRILAVNERPRWPGADTKKRHARQADYVGMLKARHATQAGLRNLFDGLDYTHVDTSILQTTASGAAARTFDTVTNFDGMERHLRIAPEIDLKVIMALSGLERVYEIGRNFRNEGEGALHHPEFTNLEAYTAYQTSAEAEQLTSEMLDTVAQSFGKNQYDFKNMPRKGLEELFAAHGIDYLADIIEPADAGDVDKLAALGDRYGVDTKDKGTSGIVDSMIKKLIRPDITSPMVVDNYLSQQLPLAASLPSDERLADAFQVIVDGAEVIKAYQEEVNPRKLGAKLLKQAGESIEDMFNTDTRLVEACEMGLPPMYGIGLGLDRFAAILSGKPIADVIPVPITGLRNQN